MLTPSSLLRASLPHFPTSSIVRSPRLAFSSTTATVGAGAATRKMAATPRFSEGTDPETAAPALGALLRAGEGEAGKEGGRWVLSRNGEGLERTFKFKTFMKTWVRRTHSPPPPSAFSFFVRVE